MIVKVIHEHQGEGIFPCFPKGTNVTLGEGGTHFLNWYACKIDGYKTYVPDCFVSGGTLVKDYNPTELVQKAGDVLVVQEIVYAWLLAKNENDEIGWIPAENVCS
jgi:hypothetical protein